jgi:hypothetical protein
MALNYLLPTFYVTSATGASKEFSGVPKLPIKKNRP